MPPRPTGYPSGGAFATASAPSTPPAPARFSTTNDAPDSSLIFWQRMRESVSVAPPAGRPSAVRTVRVGQAACERAMRGASSGVAIDPPSMVNNARRFKCVGDDIAFLHVWPVVSGGGE